MQTTYSESELFENFDALFETYDLDSELDVFELGRFQFIKKKKAKHELRALFIALWKLALKQSFPEQCESCFTSYLQENKLDVDGAGNATTMFRSIEVYNTLLAEHGTKNFSGVAEFLTSQLVADAKRKQHITLKLALTIRSTYNMLFEKLI